MFLWKSHAGLKFHFSQNDRYEIHTVLRFISPQFMRTQIKSWVNTEVRFSTEIKSHAGLSLFRLSCERTLTVCMENPLQVEISLCGQFGRSEICSEVSFTPPKVMCVLILRLPHTEVKFYPEVKSQTGLSSLRISCKRALRLECFP